MKQCPFHGLPYGTDVIYGDGKITCAFCGCVFAVDGGTGTYVSDTLEGHVTRLGHDVVCPGCGKVHSYWLHLCGGGYKLDLSPLMEEVEREQ